MAPLVSIAFVCTAWTPRPRQQKLLVHDLLIINSVELPSEQIYTDDIVSRTYYLNTGSGTVALSSSWMAARLTK